MILQTLQKSFIVKSFRDFYQEIVVYKAIALSGHDIVLSDDMSLSRIQMAAETTPLPTSSDEITLGQSIARKILNTLELTLQQQMAYANNYGGEFAARYYKEAQYLMAALADEVFLNMNWSGRAEWEANLLESKLFGTHTAGSTIFNNLDTYLLERDPSTRDIGAIYLWILGLGFKGKYRNTDDGNALADYRKKLYNFIMLHAPDLLDPDSKLFDQSYHHTLDRGTAVKLPNPKAYNWAFLGIIASFLIGSFLIWHHEISPLNKALTTIIKTGKMER
jgi:type VI secretion system protein ImpK